MSELPAYLARPPAPGPGRAAGRLRLEDRHWLLEGDPQLCIMAKRLFPGSEARTADGRRGVARFPTNRRAFGDLVWLMQRFPVEVADVAAWEAHYADACAYARTRDAFNAAPQRARPPATRFIGRLLPFQEEALAWILAHKRTLVADEMGLGKTVIALAALAEILSAPRGAGVGGTAIIVVPPHLLRHWMAKAAEFLGAVPGGRAPLLDRHAPPDDRPRYYAVRGVSAAPLADVDIVLCHYGLLAHWRPELEALAPRAVVFDEMQELRHRETLKYSAAHLLAQPAEYVIGLSGTPIYNRGGEIWNVLNAVEMHCLGDWDGFTREWCDGYGSDAVVEPERLGGHLRREGLLIRRRKEDVLTELPAKRRVIEEIDADDGLFRRLSEHAVELAVAAAGEADPLARGRLERLAVDSARKATGIAKVEAVAQFVYGLLEAGEPVLLFAHHHDVVDGLADRLHFFNPVQITGRQTGVAKDEAIKAFAAGQAPLALISLRVAGGLDGLQARARCVVFAELDWSPGVHAQCEDRAHRMGQRDSVLCYYLVTDSGTDPDVLDKLGFKVAQFTGLMQDPGETDEARTLSAKAARAHMQRIIERLRKRGAKGRANVVRGPGVSASEQPRAGTGPGSAARGLLEEPS